MAGHVSKPRMGPPLGNKNGAGNRRDRICRQSLERSLARIEWNGSRGDPGETLDRINDKLVALALEASPTSDDFKWAVEMIYNRIDGKPATAIDLSDEAGNQLIVQLVQFGTKPSEENAGATTIQ